MKAKKHIEFDRVFVYITDDKTDILWFESEDAMRWVGEALVELTQSDINDIEAEDELMVVKVYGKHGICVDIVQDSHNHEIMFANDKQMRRAGQCLIDLARIGGNEVEIKDEEK